MPVLVQPKLWKRDMRYGTWNVRITTVARELAVYKLDLAGVQEIGGTQGHCKSRGTKKKGIFES